METSVSNKRATALLGLSSARASAADWAVLCCCEDGRKESLGLKETVTRLKTLYDGFGDSASSREVTSYKDQLDRGMCFLSWSD
jgi:hypothetical protein